MGSQDPAYKSESATAYGQGDLEQKAEHAAETASRKVKKMGERSQSMISDVKHKVGGNVDKAMHATAHRLERTSHHLGKAATYLHEHDSEHLAHDLGNVIRHNPKQSMIVGVVLGFLVGRMFR